jgi:2-C-methyl-D-erythritol 2,4-cyclodiphosphate synthase
MSLNLRIGLGWDVHPFKEGRDLYLGGIKIPSDRGLDGHSDADALSHAVVDAILGALGEGDIGCHFPPSDPQWKDVSSLVFLKAVARLVRQKKARVLSIDTVLLLEAPKVKPFYRAMAESMAAALDLEPQRIQVKATTTEKLGFVGRGEGIAAEAVCLLEYLN